MTTTPRMIECEASDPQKEIAKLGDVELKLDAIGDWYPDAYSLTRLSTRSLTDLKATFYKPLTPPAGYRLETEEDRNGPKPRGTKCWSPLYPTWDTAALGSPWDPMCAYAIPELPIEPAPTPSEPSTQERKVVAEGEFVECFGVVHVEDCFAEKGTKVWVCNFKPEVPA